MTGVSVAVLRGPLHSETACTSNSVAARVDDLQFDLGEGPAWAAVGSARPVFITDLQNSPDSGRWPLFDHAIQDLPPRGLFVFPLLIGLSQVGVLTLYRSAPGPLTDDAMHTATALARVIASVLARRILTRAPIDLAAPADPHEQRDLS